MTEPLQHLLTESKRRDRSDILFEKRQAFDLPADLVYLDGNSLGPLTLAAKQRIEQVVSKEWGHDLIRSWNTANWIDLPVSVAEKIAPLIGAAPHQVICCDSISVNLFKLLAGALRQCLALTPVRRRIVTTVDNFPTDGYIAQGLADLLSEHDVKVDCVAETDIEQALSDDVAVLLLTEVNFRTGYRFDIQKITALAHQHNILVIWDLAHSAGVMPLSLDEWHVDFAVGCGYKYLNGGPGAPAFMYVAARHQAQFRQPLQGWMGHAKPFDFDATYQPQSGIKQSLAGTPGILSMAALDASLSVFDSVSVNQLYEKAMGLTEWFVELLEAHQLHTQFTNISPRQRAQRGAHVALAHEHAYAICQAWIADNVIADFRAPNILRVGFSPLFLRYEDVYIAVKKLHRIVTQQQYLNAEFNVKQGVT
ncbi:kynureninase [Alteromonas oceanisediminis]|uniref:kynureninase n=1 Tax=Alteromonas oceanisediminis TaxID=2836180 RepID=UPI001BDA2E57|nr:kynureninase [Alteromonas oceanisediminis]MBT0587235.1 kynureninase [Alteromonas oceanisediminis]